MSNNIKEKLKNLNITADKIAFTAAGVTLVAGTALGTWGDVEFTEALNAYWDGGVIGGFTGLVLGTHAGFGIDCFDGKVGGVYKAVKDSNWAKKFAAALNFGDDEKPKSLGKEEQLPVRKTPAEIRQENRNNQGVDLALQQERYHGRAAAEANKVANRDKERGM